LVLPVRTCLRLARIFHAFGLHHDNMGHIGRLLGAGGTALLTLVCAVYAIWLSVNKRATVLVNGNVTGTGVDFQQVTTAADVATQVSLGNLALYGQRMLNDDAA